MCVFSDVYVFGIGDQVKKDQLNVLASQKRGEQHVFVLKDFASLGEVFNSIISKYGVGVGVASAGCFLSCTLLLKVTRV